MFKDEIQRRQERALNELRLEREARAREEAAEVIKPQVLADSAKTSKDEQPGFSSTVDENPKGGAAVERTLHAVS